MHALFRKYGSKLAILAVAGFIAAPQPVYAETLQEALALAYTNNPALQAERAKLRSVDEGVPEALSGWRPSASAQADGGLAHQSFDTTSGNLKPYDTSVTLSQPLYRGGRTVAAMRQADENVLQERAQLTDTEQTVLVNAATAYLDMLQDQAILDLQAENQTTLEKYVAEAKERTRLGEKTHTDISQAESRLARAHADRNTAEVNLRIARSAYVRFAGQPSGPFAPPDLKLSLPPTQDAAIDQAVMHAPAVVAAEHAARAGAANIEAVRGNLLPEVSLQGSVANTWNENVPEQNINDNRTANDQVLMQVKLPLYTGGADYARLRAAYQDRGEKLRDFDEAKREAQERAEQAWEQVQTTAENISLRQQQITAAQAALDGMTQEERVGDRTSTDRLNADQELLDSRVAEIQAEHDHTVATIQMTAATGDFTAEKLALKVDLYDPDRHYNESHRRWFGTGDASAQ
jgi:TolC family type I secretion outer membrane protein